MHDEPDDHHDPSDRLFDFAHGDPPYTPPVPGVQVTEPARSLMEEVAAAAAKQAPLPARMQDPEPSIDWDDGQPIHYRQQIRRLIADAEALRKFSMRVSPKSGREEIYNPVMFEKAARARLDIFTRSVKLQEDLLSMERQVEFYRTIVSVIAAEDPAVAHRIISELRKINNPLAPIVAQEAPL